MTFQVGERFELLASLTKRPIIFLLRDPKLNISSRILQKEKGGQDPLFDQAETGWSDLQSQVSRCRKAGIRDVILDSTEFRNRPTQVVSRLFEKLDLDFSPDVLSWRPVAAADLGTTVAEQAHWSHRVLKGGRIEPATEVTPDLDWFPARYGFRAHVQECLDIYRQLLGDGQMIRAALAD